MAESVQNKKSLYDFDTLFDTITASMIYIIKNTKNKSYFKDFVNEYTSINVLKNFMLDSDSHNPFEILFKDQYKDSVKDLYNEFLENNYKNMLDTIQIQTDILGLYKLYKESKELYIDGYVNCKNKAEKDFIEQSDLNINIVENELDLDKYSFFYINNLSRLQFYDNMAGKRIYIINKRANIINADYLEKYPVFKIFIRSISISYIDMYRNNKYIGGNLNGSLF